MGRFSEALEPRLDPYFTGYYIDYNWLKGLIRETQNAILQGECLELTRGKAHAFASALDFNINRAVTFYEETLEESVTKLTNIRRKWIYLSPETLPQIHNQLKDVAKGVRNCLSFVHVNIETLRKILQRAEQIFQESAEKAAARTGKPKRRLDQTKRNLISQDEFLRRRLRPDNATTSKLESLRVYKGLDRVVEEIRRRFDAIRNLEAIWLEQGLIDPPFIRRVHERKDTLPLLVDLHQAAQQTVEKTKWYYGLVAQAKVDYEKEPVGESDFWGLFLNNYNTFLYLANYYSVIPSASLYANALGLPSVVSGLLLSMAPLSSLLSSILYSVWSNKSFKQPLLFCTILLTIGNFMYAVALDYKSAWFLFAGRLLVGLGGNRAVNRRYISDFVSLQSRTFHSALFVAVGSLGMSLGPGCQYLYHLMDFKLPYFNYTVNMLTSPGWVMCVLWIVFAFQVMIHFKEPVRHYARSRRDSRGLLQPLLTSTGPSEVITSPYTTSSGFSRQIAQLQMVDEVRKNDVSLKEVDADGTVVCLWIYFVLKLTQEAFQTASPMFTSYAYSWTATDVGYLLALIGVIVLPANLIIGCISNIVEDRTLNVVSLLLLVVGSGVTINWYSSSAVAMEHYVIGALLVFLSAQCLEAVCMSLLSKVMPKTMSKGLWNSGFLSTEAGTFGRVVGAALITLAGSAAELMGNVSVVELQNLVMIPCIVLCLITLVFVFWKWKSLIPISERLGRHVADDADQILKSDVWKRMPELRPLCVQIQEITNPAASAQESKLASSIRSLRSSLFMRSPRQRPFSSPILPLQPHEEGDVAITGQSIIEEDTDFNLTGPTK